MQKLAAGIGSFPWEGAGLNGRLRALVPALDNGDQDPVGFGALPAPAVQPRSLWGGA